MAGILSAIKLREAGHTDFTVYEKGDRVGGTWRENTYPGLSCDVPSHSTRTRSPSIPIGATASHRDPRSRPTSNGSLTSTESSNAPASAKRSLGAPSRTAGGISRPRAGGGTRRTWSSPPPGCCTTRTFRTLRASTPSPGLRSTAPAGITASPIDGARVGIVGTGSTAVQLTGALAERVEQLSLFQRTAQWIFPQDNPAYDDAERAAFRDDAANAAGELRPTLRAVRRLRQRHRRRRLRPHEVPRRHLPRQPREQHPSTQSFGS